MTTRRKILEHTKTLRGAGRDLLAQYPAGTAFLALFATLSTIVPFLRRSLIDVRDMEGRFEPWRVLTGHFVHGGLGHLALNLSAFVPLAVWRERKRGFARLGLELIAIAALVALGVRALHSGWSTYCGLSGIVYGLLVVCLLDDAAAADSTNRSAARAAVGPVVVTLLALKTAAECLQNGWVWQRELLESALGVTYLSGSHSAGLFAGLCVVFASAVQARAATQRERNALAAPSGSGESMIAPIMAAPAAPALLSSTADSGVTPPSA